jgi:uracil-DNA glycosylase
MQIDINKIKIDSSWKEVLKNEFLSQNFANIKANFLKAKASGEVYPPNELIFNAFNLTPFYNVKVVILGQDPYHGKGQAMGLSFSVPNKIQVPPSLVNIYKEIFDDLGIREPNSGDLSYWAKQGVLLLNSTLSVTANQPNSHANFGWQGFTDGVIKAISANLSNVVFMLWGNMAKAKAPLIDGSKHLILTAAHPSPLARGAFFGSRHFSKANFYLRNNNKIPIDWDLNNA